MLFFRADAEAGAVESAEVDDVVDADGLAHGGGLAVDEGAVTAALIDDEAGSGFDDELRVAARDVGMGEDEVVLRQAADGERRVRDGNGAATGAVDEDKRDRGRMRGGHLAEIIDSVQRSAYSVQGKTRENGPRKRRTKSHGAANSKR